MLRKITFWILGSVTFLAIGFWLCNLLVPTRETAAPDQFQLGRVYTGSAIEFSARFLVSSQSRLDKAFTRVVNKMPAAWQPTLIKMHPSSFRKNLTPAQLAGLKPEVRAPPFIQVKNVTPRQNPNWYSGRPFVEVEMALNTSKAGDYVGDVQVTLDNRKASLPVRVAIHALPKDVPQMLIATTPFEADSTDRGSNFEATTQMIASLSVSPNYLDDLPERLDHYQTILLAGSAMARLSATNASRLRTFAEKGGRLVMACDAFYWGTTPSANQILINYGLQVVNKDFGLRVTVTNIIEDPLTRNIHHLEFHRPVLIQTTDGSKARILAMATDGSGGFVAVSRLANGGEIAVVTQSLWWYWLDQFKTNSDNVRLMGNLLRGTP